MFSLFPFNLFGCFGGHRKKKRPGTNFKVIYQSGLLEPFKERKKAVRFKEEEEVPAKDEPEHHQTESHEDVKQDPSSAPSQKPDDVQGVKPNIVLVEGIKCRSQLKCKARPGGICEPRVLYRSWGGGGGDASPGNKQIFHTWLFLEAGWWLCACLYSLLLHFHTLFYG